MSTSNSSSSNSSDLLIDVQNRVAVITLNRPKAMNALNLSMIRTFYPRLKEWEQSGEVSLILIKGAGGKAFCSGGDIRAITEVKGGPVQQAFFREEYMLDHLIGTTKIPYVAVLNGIVMGGGVGISVHGKYRLCCENTVFAMPETGIGLVPDVGGAFFLPRLPGALGAFLGLTGHRIKGRDCLHAGIATHAVSQEDIPALEAELRSLSTVSEANVKNVLDSFTAKSSFSKDQAFSLAAELPLLDAAFSLPTVEEILERLSAEGAGTLAARSLETLKRASPSSLKVALRQIRTGATLPTLADCLQMEFRLVMRCCQNADFYEGVRALLIDRDNKPQWSPPTLFAVSEDLVDSYFNPLPDDMELKL